MLLNVKIIIVDYKGVARGEQGERPPPPATRKICKGWGTAHESARATSIAGVNSNFRKYKKIFIKIF